MSTTFDGLTEAEAKEFASRWLPAWTGNDPERLASFYAEDCFYSDPAIPEGVEGREALTRYFLRHRLSSSLPRKFKIGFEGCAEDHVKAAINDIGWLGRIDNGRRGFRVLVGGGTSTRLRTGGAAARSST